MTFVPNSQVKLCSVPFSDYTNVLSFGTDDTKRYNYFSGKTVYNLTPDTGYSYVKGTGAIRVNKNKESLYNINYMIYRNTNFAGSKWFYAFVDSIEYINANCTEIRFSIDAWQTWESALNFRESYIERQHIPKSEDKIGANLQPENFSNIRYVEEKRFRQDFKVTTNQTNNFCIILLCTEWYDESTSSFKKPTTSAIDYTYSGLYLIPFYYNDLINGNLQKYIAHYTSDTANKADSIISIFHCPIDFAWNNSNQSIRFESGKPIGYYTTTTNVPVVSETQVFISDKMESIDIGPHETTDIKYAHNKKLFSFPFTKVVLTNNNGSSLTFRQEWFDGAETTGDNIQFRVSTCPLPPVKSVCYPRNYREGDFSNGILLDGFQQCAWSIDTFKQWLALNQNTLAYQEYAVETNAAMGFATDLMKFTAKMADKAGTAAASLATGKAVESTSMSELANFASQNLNRALNLLQGKYQIESRVQDMQLQPNHSRGTTNGGNVIGKQRKLCFTLMFFRPSYEQFKQIDNYFDKFGYAINDFKSVNYNNRSNYDYIKTTQIIVDGDVPEDDLNVIKSIFNNGVRIWHDPTTFLNYSAYNYNQSNTK